MKVTNDESSTFYNAHNENIPHLLWKYDFITACVVNVWNIYEWKMCKCDKNETQRSLCNNNNGYLEHLTRTGLKWWHIFFMYIFSIFNAYNTNVRASARTHTHIHKHTHTHTRTERERVVYQGNGTEEKVFKKRKVFKEDFNVWWRKRLWVRRKLWLYHIICKVFRIQK